MIGLRSVLAASAILPLASACYAPVPETIYSPCSATGSSGWTAALVRYKEPHRKSKLMLEVAGTVTLANGGGASLEAGGLRRLDVRVQEILLRTDPPGADGGTRSTERVGLRMRAPKNVAAVAIRCGDGEIAKVAVIPEREPAPAS